MAAIQSCRLRFAAALFAVCAVSATRAPAEEPVSAVLKAREVSFTYRSRSTPLPCHELEGRAAMILRAIGARDDLRVTATGCDQFMTSTGHIDSHDPWRSSADPYGRADVFDRDDPLDPRRNRFGARERDREQIAHVRVWLLSPVPVTAEVLKEMERDKSRRELISRVTRNPMVAMNDPIVFAAERQEVTLSRRTMKLEPKDCELLEQMGRSVFRELGVRVVRGANCHRGSLIAPEVTVEALLPVGYQLGPPPQQAEQPAPVPPAESPASASEVEAASEE
jgi:hypothetical protein